MKCAAVMLATSLIFAGEVIPEDLPPEVLLLSHVRTHIAQELQHLPNISCLETVRREIRPKRGKMRPLDTVRLEVLTDGRKELFASPGDRKFSEQHPISYVGSGAMGDGFFRLYLRTVLMGEMVSEKYKGKEEIAGRLLTRYDYRLPVMWSGQIFRLQEGSGTVGVHGSFWVDSETYDVVRLELNADDFPPTLPLTEAVTNINYARTDLGDGVEAFLPQSGDFRMVKFSGEVDHNQIDFTHCRQFEAQSTIDFGAPGSSEQMQRFGVASLDDTLRPLTNGLRIAVNLQTRISSNLAVGALINGVVAANVLTKHSMVIAAGSPVRGRIRRLERYTDPVPHFVIALEFTEVELQGIRHRFYADLVGIDSAPGVEMTLSTQNRTEVIDLPFGGRQFKSAGETLWLNSLPGVATFFFRGSYLVLPQGFRTVWKTRPWGP